MRTFLTLLRTNLNITLGISALKYRYKKEKRKLWEPVVVGLSIIIGIGSIVSVVSLITLGMFLSAKAMGKPELVLTVSFVMSQLTVLFFGLFYIMGTFYFSKDMDILIPLPLKASQVLGSKFVIVMLGEYVTALPILLSAFLIFGVGTGQGIPYWLKSLVVILMAPVLPLTMDAIFIIILMKFANIRRNKDLFATIGGFMGIFAAVGWNALVQRIPETGKDDFLNYLMGAQAGLIEQAGQKFPPSIWVTYGLSLPDINGLGYFGLYLLVSLLLFIVLMFLGEKVYYRSLLSGQEVNRKRKTIGEKELSRSYNRISSPMVSIFWREWKIFIRTPIYLINGVAGMVIAPLLLIMPLITQRNQFNELIGIVRESDFIMQVTLVGLGLALLATNINIIAATAVSREGHTFWISKLIPVSPRDQVMGKLLHGIIMECLGLAVTIIILAIMHVIPISSLLIILVLGFTGNILLVSLNLIIDVLRPKLEWTNPQEAVKQNLNGLFGMLVTMLVIGALGAAAFAMVIANLPAWIVYIVLGTIMILLAVPSTLGLFALAEYRYRNMEV